MSSFKWEVPEGEPVSQLKILNSFSRKKDLFVPKDGRSVKWYACGPTVYDSAHMGHARAYITFDIIKRILRDYFNYDLLCVMNITDIDDKIITRARQQYLFKQYKQSNPTSEQILADVHICKEKVIKDLQGEKDPEKLFKLNKLKSQLDEVTPKLSTEEIIDQAKDGLCELLDKRKGHEVNDQAVFRDLPRYYESDYFEDMRALGVESPDILTRVSEYVPEVVEFVEKIIAKGFAYESNNSVYFDVDKFSQTPNHYYAKLVPEALGDQKLLKEGEGSLAAGDTEKKSPRDFALWKNSKPGEPFWDSPWGKGRPGWHIECSVMASCVLGQSMDIHGGGVDLKFPHHDNEIAQAEAYYDNNDWVRYFLHSGHLKIDGLKMSKSLKNFITIKDALNKYSAVQIRILFLLHEWSSTLDYGYETMKEAISFEKYVGEFFLTVKDILRKDPEQVKYQKISKTEQKLFEDFIQVKSDVHNALCDSFNTPKVMLTIKNFVSQINTYISSINNAEPNYALLRSVAVYVTHLLTIFGVVPKSENVGFAQTGASGDTAKTLLPLLESLALFREDARQSAFTLLKVCDDLRDNVLPEQGVRLEDKPGQKSVIKYVGREAIEREKKQAEDLAAKKAAEKDALKKRQKEQAAQKDAQNKMNPKEMFNDPTKYSKYDEQGLPTHYKDGSEITDTQRKKLAKQQDQQRQRYEKFNSEAS